MCTEYNGYANYQTWNVSLWINNDQGLYDHFNELAQYAIEETAPSMEFTGYSSHESRTAWLANRIEEEVMESNPVAIDGAASMWTDIMGHAMAAVDWFEIAENLIEEHLEVTND